MYTSRFLALLKNKIGKSGHIGPASPHGNNQRDLLSLFPGACTLQLTPVPSILYWSWAEAGVSHHLSFHPAFVWK